MARPNLFAPNSPEGAGLNNLVMALYSGDGEAKRAEREAMLENRRLDQQIKRNSIEEHARKRAAEDAAKRAEAENIANLVNAISGGRQQGDDVRAAFDNGGVLPSQPETAEMPGIIGGYKPQGYDAASRVLTGLYGERALGGKSFKSAQEGAESAQKQNLIADALAGLVSTDQAKGLAPVMRALKGDPMFNDTQGRILDYSTGVANESGPQAVASVGKTEAEAAQERALAGLQRAQTGAILPNQTVTGPGGVTFPVRGEDLSRAITGSMFPKPAPPLDSRPIPAGIVKDEAELINDISVAGTIKSDLASLKKQIDEDGLQLGLLRNVVSQGRNVLGWSDTNSQAFASFSATLQKLRNDSLRLNKGAQTEGDATRAWNELFASMNDPGVVSQRLGEIAAINERAIAYKSQIINHMRSNYGRGPVNTQPFSNQPAAVGADAAAKKTYYDAQGNRLN